VGILLWPVFGLIAGALARFLMAGKVLGGIIAGIVGAVDYGFIGA